LGAAAQGEKCGSLPDAKHRRHKHLSRYRRRDHPDQKETRWEELRDAASVHVGRLLDVYTVKKSRVYPLRTRYVLHR